MTYMSFSYYAMFGLSIMKQLRLGVDRFSASLHKHYFIEHETVDVRFVSTIDKNMAD